MRRTGRTVEFGWQCEAPTTTAAKFFDVCVRQRFDGTQRMFYVQGGEVALERCGENGERIVLQRARNGFLAEASLQAARYHCDAIVTRAGSAIGLPLKMMLATLQNDAGFALRWMAMLSSDIRTLRLRCERLSLKGVEARLLHLIDSEGENGRYVVQSTLKNLALELGVSHEALYRELSSMERRGIVVRSEGELIVPL
jgi:CRP/FNR family transcriptional regulator, dissimilatory nitrate respiration regulator